MDALHGPDERGPAQGMFTELHDEAAECSHVGLLTIGAVVSSGDIVGVRPCDDGSALAVRNLRLSKFSAVAGASFDGRENVSLRRVPIRR